MIDQKSKDRWDNEPAFRLCQKAGAAGANKSSLKYSLFLKMRLSAEFIERTTQLFIDEVEDI